MLAAADLLELFIAAVFVGLAIYLLALGFRGVDISVVAPFRYIYLLTSAIGGYLMFRELPDGWTVVGALPDRGQRPLYAAPRSGAPPRADRNHNPRPLIRASRQGPRPAAFDQLSIDGRRGLRISLTRSPGLRSPAGRGDTGLRAAGRRFAGGRDLDALLNVLLKFSRAIDAVNQKFGVLANYLVLAAALLSAANAGFRYGLNALIELSREFHFLSGIQVLINWYGNNSNAFLEAQWYMFAAMVLFGAAWTLKVNEHVRVDLLYSTVSDRARIWIDLLGGIFFLMPMCIVLMLVDLAVVHRIPGSPARSRPTPAASCAGRSS